MIRQRRIVSGVTIVATCARSRLPMARPSLRDGPPAFAGIVLHHAYAVLDAGTLQLEAVSPAVPVSLVP